MPVSHTQEIACQQVLVEDGAVFSIQWSIFPHAIVAGLTSGTLSKRYFGSLSDPALPRFGR